jgi:histidinol phosphatase-like enzyme (inositol monophosphatase family)
MVNRPEEDAAVLDDMLGFAEETATRVRAIALNWFRKPLAIDTKADESPVTIADRSVEQAIRQAIAERFPEHGILGEEYGLSHSDAKYVWSIDPIDGTRSFISGYPLWGSLLALLREGKPVLGVIDIPCTGERWTGSIHRGSRFAGQPCRTRDTQSLADATLYATTPDIFHGAEIQAFERLSRAVHLRRFGGDCYNYGLLASGHIDLVLEAGLQPYDYLAMTPIIEQAGGIVTDWSGRALSMRSGGRVLASASRTLHEQALALVNGVT